MARELIKLNFPQKLIKKPVIFNAAKKYDIIPNIRRAKVTEKLGEMVLEIDGKPENLKKSIKYLTKLGVKVEPIIGDIIE